jgi:hypothetical protein
VLNWFKGEAVRIYEIFSDGDASIKFDTIIEVIKSNGGAASPRDLMRLGPCYKSSGEAKRKLDEMVREGIGYWSYRRAGEKGGRPKNEFVLT